MAWGTLIMGLAGGLALFLIGMAEVTDALKALGDDRLRWALARLSSNRFLGATTGGVVTAVIQSSSVTTVLTVGFVSAGLLSLTQAASVIIGANLGTTVTAQVIALKVTDYALALLAVGALLSVAVKRRQVRYLGSAVAGLGFVFLGMDIMSDAMSPLKTYEPFLPAHVRRHQPVHGRGHGRRVHRPRPVVERHHRDRGGDGGRRSDQPRDGDRHHPRCQHRYLCHRPPGRHRERVRGLSHGHGPRVRQRDRGHDRHPVHPLPRRYRRVDQHQRPQRLAPPDRQCPHAVQPGQHGRVPGLPDTPGRLRQSGRPGSSRSGGR